MEFVFKIRKLLLSQIKFRTLKYEQDIEYYLSHYDNYGHTIKIIERVTEYE